MRRYSKELHIRALQCLMSRERAEKAVQFFDDARHQAEAERLVRKWRAPSGDLGAEESARARSSQRSSDSRVDACDEIITMARETSGRRCRFVCEQKSVNVMAEGSDTPRIWIVPMSRVVRVGAYVRDPENWLMRIRESQLPAQLVRNGRAVQTSISPKKLHTHGMLLSELIAEAFAPAEVRSSAT